MGSAQDAAQELKELSYLVSIVYQLRIVTHFYLPGDAYLVKVALK